MDTISRQPRQAADSNFDLIIIGGGIYGIMVSFEAAKRGLRALLIEKDDFGGGTSLNSLRILHGGLRYLQSLDLQRIRESVTERQWFLHVFKHLTQPLSCMMPLYGKGAKRPSIFGVALRINDFLSKKYNLAMNYAHTLPAGKIISPTEAEKIFPDIDRGNLQGAGIWHDASMPDSQRIVMEMLRWSCSLGTTALNYVKSTELLTTANKVAGLRAQDQESGEFYEFRAPVIINAAGPWSREIATAFDQDHANLFRGSLAWNMVLNRPSLSQHALALSPKKPNAQTYFLVPWKGMIMAGTGHAPWTASRKKIHPSTEELESVLTDLNDAIPDFNVTIDDILHIFSGLLPATETGGTILTKRETLINHQLHGGPAGLHSVSGVKFTTARLVAEKTVQMAFTNSKVMHADSMPSLDSRNRYKTTCKENYNWRPLPDDNEWHSEIKKLIDEEAVLHLDDLIFRRTSLGSNPTVAQNIAPDLCKLFDWSEERCQEETARVNNHIQSFSAPDAALHT